MDAYSVGEIGEMRNAETKGFRVWLLAEAGTELGERGSEVDMLNDVVASVSEHLQHRSTAQEVPTALRAPVVHQTCNAFHCRCCKTQNANANANEIMCRFCFSLFCLESE